MPRSVTSFRLDATLRSRLADAAQRERVSVTALVEQLLAEGLAEREHEGIQFKAGPAGRRAALAGGPDVWEVADAVRAAEGAEAERIDAAATSLGLHPRQVEIALDYAAAHRAEIEAWIAANEAAVTEAERLARERTRLIA